MPVGAPDEELGVERGNGPVVSVSGQAEQVRLAEGPPPERKDPVALAAAGSLVPRREPEALPDVVRLIVPPAPEANTPQVVLVAAAAFSAERTSVGEGKSVSERVDTG